MKKERKFTVCYFPRAVADFDDETFIRIPIVRSKGNPKLVRIGESEVRLEKSRLVNATVLEDERVAITIPYETLAEGQVVVVCLGPKLLELDVEEMPRDGTDCPKTVSVGQVRAGKPRVTDPVLLAFLRQVKDKIFPAT